MHYLMLVTLAMHDGATSSNARHQAMELLLADDSFCGEGARFGSPLCDWFVIGGRWSGWLTESLLGDDYKAARQVQPRDALNRLWQRFGGTEPHPDNRNDRDHFSLIGQNHFCGTPLNLKEPDRVPGGSSSGSASAVACGLVDFALGTDTGGSVRVPAGNCGIWGFRPSHGFVSMAGVNPLASSFDTVGVLAQSAEVLTRVATVLLACAPESNAQPSRIHLIRDAFDLADAEVQRALIEPVRMLGERFGACVRETSLRAVAGDEAGGNFPTWLETYRLLQLAEIRSCLGSWNAEAKPEFGPAIAATFELTNQVDRRQIAAMVERRERYYQRLQGFLGPHDLLCLPTAPALAPRKDAVQGSILSGSDYYPRALALTSIAGIGRLPQVSLPLARSAGVPVGVSLLTGRGHDAFLLRIIQHLS